MKQVDTRRAHAQFIDSVISGRPPTSAPDHRIRDSWRRCVSSYQLNPDRAGHPTIVSGAELKHRRGESELLYSIAQIEMMTLARLLNAPVGVMLTDHEGVILAYTGAREFTEVARNSGLCEGAVWSEAEQGTNGMGTCLAIREPVLIEEDEHFLSQNVALTCCGAPIRDGRGDLIGALNISGRLRLSAAPTLALVRLAVQNVENRVLLAEHQPHHHLLRFHPHREFISTAGEGILAIDDAGTVTGANLSALEWLGVSDHAGLCGQTVERLFGLDLGRLEALGHDPAFARPLPSRERGSLCYGIIQRATDHASAGSRTAPRCCDNRLMEAEHEALREVLQRHGWNVSRAAAQLRISRRTLHRKLKWHGLQRYCAWESGESD